MSCFSGCRNQRKAIESGLNSIDLKTEEMQGILITHEHVDHIAGLGVLARRYGLPMYATPGTIDAILHTKSVGTIDPALFHEIHAGEDFTIGDMTIEPIAISHDAAEPVAYKMKQPGKSMAVMTDLGIYDDHIVEKLKGLDVLLLEANHDVHMLQVGSYPYPLKQRILGEKGHLSNELSGRLLGEVLHDHFGTVFLGHLSKKITMRNLRTRRYGWKWRWEIIIIRGMIFLMYVAKRDEPSELVRF